MVPARGKEDGRSGSQCRARRARGDMAQTCTSHCWRTNAGALTRARFRRSSAVFPSRRRDPGRCDRERDRLRSSRVRRAVRPACARIRRPERDERDGAPASARSLLSRRRDRRRRDRAPRGAWRGRPGAPSNTRCVSGRACRARLHPRRGWSSPLSSAAHAGRHGRACPTASGSASGSRSAARRCHPRRQGDASAPAARACAGAHPAATPRPTWAPARGDAGWDGAGWRVRPPLAAVAARRDAPAAVAALGQPRPAALAEPAGRLPAGMAGVEPARCPGGHGRAGGSG